MRRNILYLIAIFCIYIIIDISIVHAFSITHNSATDVTPTDRTAAVRWITDDSSDSRVNYGATASLGSSATDSENTTSHSVTVSGLVPGTLYYYSLASVNGSGATATANNNGNFYTFRAVADTTPPYINASLPAYHNSNWIGFTGVTEPDSIINVYVNRPASDTGTLNYDNIASSDAAGIFVFSRVSLPLDVNNVVLWAKDLAGNTNTAAYTVEIDAVPPNITLAVTSADSGLNFTLKELPSLSPVSSLTVKGTASEAVNITYTVNNSTQTLSAESIHTGGSSISDENKPTPFGTDFEFTLSLDETMENFVSIVFADKGNNIVRYENVIKVDPEGPKIVSHNLKDLDPSYVQNIKITGNASKPNVDVIVYVNNKTRSVDTWSTGFLDTVKHFGGLAIGAYEESYTTKTDSNGKFELTVFLTQDITSDTSEWDLTQESDLPSPQPVTVPGQSTLGYNATAGRAYGVPSVWDNLVKIVAVDSFGRSDDDEYKIRFAKCGIGGDWDIEMSTVTPSVITPDHLNKPGLAELSFSGTLKWQGPGEDKQASAPNKKRPTVESLAVRKYPLNDEIKKKYAINPDDLAPDTPNSMLDPVSQRTFYVSVPLNKVNYTSKNWEELRKKVKKDDISIMIPLELEINYFYTDDYGNIIRKVQRQCTDIRTILDIRIPPDVIPKWLLEDSIKFIDNTIKAIDSILEPLKQITMAVFVTCLLSWVVYFVVLVQKKMVCKADKGGDQCKSAEAKLEKVKISMHWICDRIFCPKVPMINKYIKTAGKPGDTEGCDKNQADSMVYIAALEGKPTLKFNLGSSDEQPNCGQKYMNDWDSACVGITNELTESKCLLGLESGDTGLQSDPKCTGSLKKVLNTFSLSGICTRGKDDKSSTGCIETSEGGSVNYYCPNGDGTWHYADVNKEYDKKDAGVPKESQFIASKSCSGSLGSYDGKNVYVLSREQKSKMTYTGADTVNAQIGGKGEAYSLDVIECKDAGVTVQGKKCAVDAEGLVYTVEGSEGATTPEGETVVNKATPAYANCAGKGTSSPPQMQADYHHMQREYLVNPTEGLINSVRCVCLPAINGHLMLWRNILAQIRNCLEAIIVTGDGSPGVCRAVLSMYVCDVIYKAIRCLTKLSGSGAGKSIGESSIGGFVESLSSAGQDIQKEITGRYGDTGLYNTMFNEKKLMTAVCLFAFTGDFDFDIEGLLTGGAAVPIESKVFVFPAERRFMGSNPMNRGFASWIYHVGVGIAAGSDINYHVELVCSETPDCNAAEGFIGGRCDCFGKGEKPFDITHEVGGGFLKVGEMVGPNDGDVYVKIKDAPWRYDKVRVRITPGSGVKGIEPKTVEQKIVQVGDKPLAECQFDLASAEFRCGFAIGDVGYAAFIGPLIPSQTEPYMVGQTLSVTAKIDKRSPNYDPMSQDTAKSNPQNQIPFILKYFITDVDTKRTFYQNPMLIGQDGTKDYMLPSTPLQITADLIMSGGYEGGTYEVSDVPVKGLTLIGVLSIVLPSQVTTTLISDFYVKFNDGAVIPPTQGGTYMININKIDICEGTIQQTNEGKKFSEPVTCGSHPGTAEVLSTGDLKIVYKKLEIKVKAADVKANAYFAIDVTAPKTTTTKSCDESWDMTTPKRWIFTAALYRCVRRDTNQPYSQSNCLDTNTIGEPVQYGSDPGTRELELKIICSKNTVGVCAYNVPLISDCKCGDQDFKWTNKRGYCYLDWYSGNGKPTLAKGGYVQCVDGQTAKDSGGVQIPENSGRYYCGCKSDGSMEDCTTKPCAKNAQGLLGCW